MNEALPSPTIQQSSDTFIINDFRNNIYNAAKTFSTPQNMTSIKSIKVSVELPFEAGEQASMWIFRSSASGYSLFKYAVLNSTTVPGYRIFADLSSGINNIYYSSNDRIVVSIRPNGTLAGKAKAITVRIEMAASSGASDLQTFAVEAPLWGPPV